MKPRAADHARACTDGQSPIPVPLHLTKTAQMDDPITHKHSYDYNN